MSWSVLIGLALVLLLVLLAALARRTELARMERRVRERERAVRHRGTTELLRQPVVDLTRCLGCGTCIAACPEKGVLALVHGQAQVVLGARCVGHAACERECPVGAITVTLANVATRRDVPVLSAQLEAHGTPGLFLAGEVTAHALIKSAIDQGTAVAAEVARRTASARGAADVLDLVVVGAGPAGIACSLEARRRDLRFATLDQADSLGGTVANYPRRKLVVTQPIELPLHGALERTSYAKEELVELWNDLSRTHELPLHCGETFLGLERDERGHFVVRTSRGAHTARHVCLALGRRGSPRKLGVEGERLPKVAYALLDAHSYHGRRVLVVGGGDSAVETALALAEQPGNEVTLAYRGEEFVRLRARNAERFETARASGELRVLVQSEVRTIRADEVELDVHGVRTVLANDEVFAMIGGSAPFELLERSGVSFDPALREVEAAPTEQGTGLVRALAVALACTLATLAWATWNADYYLLPQDARATHDKHELLRPGLGLGLALGIAAAAAIGVNLLYVLRRMPHWKKPFGSLRAWMTSHVATGVLALLFATLHAAMAPRDTVGGHALWLLAALLTTGAIGRYFYAYLPRAANGRELELEEVKLQLARVGEQLDDGYRAFAQRARDEVARLIDARQWRSNFAGRVFALLGGRRDLRAALARIAIDGRSSAVPEEQVRETCELARRAHDTALAAAHFEDLRAILAAWRWMHRWVAALLVVLVALHVAYALTYGSALHEGVSP